MAAHATATTKDIMRKELISCAKDPTYFLKTYAKIVHPLRGRIPFETYPFQDDCIRDFMDHRFNIVLKSRQLGLSTVTAGFATWFAMFQRDQTVLIIATKLDVAMNFIKKVKVIIEGLPLMFQSLIKITGETKKSVTFSNGSNITAIPTSEDAGRSEALSLLIVDEAAIIKDFEEVWTGLYPTISTGGRAILLSTPKGAAGQFYDIWQMAVNKDNDFNPIKLMWSVHPEHDEEWLKKETRGFSHRKVAQEFLCDFNASGDTFLQPEDMEYLRTQIKSPIDKLGPDQNIWIWERPIVGEKYVLSADVSRGNADDFSTFHIFRDSTNSMVAEYKGKIPPDEFGQMIFEIVKKYNGALVCPESNTYGYSTIRTLKLLGYKNMYYEGKRPGYIPMDDKEMAGFSTQKNSREKILANLEKSIRNKTLKIFSERLYLELKTFVWVGQRARAQEGSHDDLIMSMAIGTWLLDPNAGGNAGDDYAKAFLNAMSVSTRAADNMIGMGKDVKPLMDPNFLLGSPTRPSNSTTQESPRQQSFREQLLKVPTPESVDPNDFSWLIK